MIYLGGFSKTLAANLRVGFFATSHEIARDLADRKMLAALTSTEITERVVYKVLAEEHYRKHSDRLRSKLDAVRDKTARQMERIGVKINFNTPAGMFLWTDMGCDTNVLTEKAMAEGYLLVPGSLFSPSQLPSTNMRFNIAAMGDPGLLKFLERTIDQLRSKT